MQYRGILKVTVLPLCLESQGHDAQLCKPALERLRETTQS